MRPKRVAYSWLGEPMHWRGREKFQWIFVIQINGIQRRQLVSHQLVRVLILTVGWFFRAHVRGCSICWPWLLLSEAGRNRRQALLLPDSAPMEAIALLLFESKERHFVICFRDGCIFSSIENKNDQKPLVINTSHPLLNSIQHSRKAMFLCQITWGLCVWIWQMESMDGKYTWMHTEPREHPWPMRVGQKVNKARFRRVWTEKVKRVKYRALRFSLQYNGYQGIYCNCFKTDEPVFSLFQACCKSKLQKRESSTAVFEKSREKKLSNFILWMLSVT